MELNLENITSQIQKTEEIRNKIRLTHVATDSEVMNYWTLHPFMHVAAVVTDKTAPLKLLFDNKGRPTVNDETFEKWYQQQLTLAERLQEPIEGDLRKEVLAWPEEKRRKTFENIKQYIIGVFDTGTDFAVSTRTGEIAQKIKVENPAQLRFALGNILRILGGKLIGFNIEGYDVIKYTSPRRDENLLKRINDDKVKKMCSEPDGMFGVTPAWASAYYSGKTWKEALRIAGLTLFDCLQPAQNYFGALTVDRTLVTYSHMINFIRDLGFDFTKVMQTYKQMQEFAEKAQNGDLRAAYESERYGFEDTEEHLEIGKQLIPIFEKMEKHLDMKLEFLFRASKGQIATRYWNMITVSQEGIPQHKLDSKDYELFDLKDFKEKIIKKYFDYKSIPWNWGFHQNTTMIHVPFLIPTLRPLIQRFDQLEGLTREFYNSEDALERLIYAQILETALVHPIKDFERAEKGELKEDVFELRYKTTVEEFRKMLDKKTTQITEQKLESKLFNGEIFLEEYFENLNSMIPLLESFSGSFHSLTGHFLFADQKISENVIKDRTAIEVSPRVFYIEDLVKDENPIFVSSGKLIIPNKNQHLFDFRGYMTSEGIRMPSHKRRHLNEYDKKEEPMFLTKLKFDFIHAAFESKEKALEVLWDYGQKIRNNELPPENFNITITPRTNPQIYAARYRVHRRFYRIQHLNLKLDQPQTCLIVEENGQEELIPKEKLKPEHKLAIDAYMSEAYEEGSFMDINVDAIFFTGINETLYFLAKQKVKKWYKSDGEQFPTDQAKGQLLLFEPSPSDRLKNMIYLLDRIKYGYASQAEKEEFKSHLTNE